MSPVDEFKNQLFFSAGASPDRVVEFSCDHVVPDSNVLPLVFSKGPCSVPLDFTFKNRKETKLVRVYDCVYYLEARLVGFLMLCNVIMLGKKSFPS